MPDYSLSQAGQRLPSVWPTPNSHHVELAHKQGSLCGRPIAPETLLPFQHELNPSTRQLLAIRRGERAWFGYLIVLDAAHGLFEHYVTRQQIPIDFRCYEVLLLEY